MRLKWIDGDRVAAASPAKKEAMASLIAWALDRIEDLRGGKDVEGISASEEGVVVDVRWDEYARCCKVGTERRRVTVPWDVVLSDASLGDWFREDEERRRCEERERREREEREAAERLATEALARDRAEYERLRRVFEPSAG